MKKLFIYLFILIFSNTYAIESFNADRKIQNKLLDSYITKYTQNFYQTVKNYNKARQNSQLIKAKINKLGEVVFKTKKHIIKIDPINWLNLQLTIDGIIVKLNPEFSLKINLNNIKKNISAKKQTTFFSLIIKHAYASWFEKNHIKINESGNSTDLLLIASLGLFLSNDGLYTNIENLFSKVTESKNECYRNEVLIKKNDSSNENTQYEILNRLLKIPQTKLSSDLKLDEYFDYNIQEKTIKNLKALFNIQYEELNQGILSCKNFAATIQNTSPAHEYILLKKFSSVERYERQQKSQQLIQDQCIDYEELKSCLVSIYTRHKNIFDTRNENLDNEKESGTLQKIKDLIRNFQNK